MKVTPQTITKWIREDKLKADKLGGKSWRIKQSDFDNYINSDNKK
ncbi:MAG: helix-turn-helix domain-containing protein [Clostridium baratii]